MYIEFATCDVSLGFLVNLREPRSACAVGMPKCCLSTGLFPPSLWRGVMCG